MEKGRGRMRGRKRSMVAEPLLKERERDEGLP